MTFTASLPLTNWALAVVAASASATSARATGSFFVRLSGAPPTPPPCSGRPHEARPLETDRCHAVRARHRAVPRCRWWPRSTVKSPRPGGSAHRRAAWPCLTERRPPCAPRLRTVYWPAWGRNPSTYFRAPPRVRERSMHMLDHRAPDGVAQHVRRTLRVEDAQAVLPADRLLLLLGEVAEDLSSAFLPELGDDVIRRSPLTSSSITCSRCIITGVRTSGRSRKLGGVETDHPGVTGRRTAGGHRHGRPIQCAAWHQRPSRSKGLFSPVFGRFCRTVERRHQRSSASSPRP